MVDSLSLDEKFISNIFQKYAKAKIILQSVDSLHEKEEQYGKVIIDEMQLVDYHNHLQIVETILALMPKEEYTCLIRDFLSVDDSTKSWWKKLYSQESYQKLRTKAINRFLYLFLI